MSARRGTGRNQRAHSVWLWSCTALKRWQNFGKAILKFAELSHIAPRAVLYYILSLKLDWKIRFLIVIDLFGSQWQERLVYLNAFFVLNVNERLKTLCLGGALCTGREWSGAGRAAAGGDRVAAECSKRYRTRSDPGLGGQGPRATTYASCASHTFASCTTTVTTVAVNEFNVVIKRLVYYNWRIVLYCPCKPMS